MSILLNQSKIGGSRLNGKNFHRGNPWRLFRMISPHRVSLTGNGGLAGARRDK